MWANSTHSFRALASCLQLLETRDSCNTFARLHHEAWANFHSVKKDSRPLDMTGARRRRQLIRRSHRRRRSFCYCSVERRFVFGEIFLGYFVTGKKKRKEMEQDRSGRRVLVKNNINNSRPGFRRVLLHSRLYLVSNCTVTKIMAATTWRCDVVERCLSQQPGIIKRSCVSNYRTFWPFIAPTKHSDTCVTQLWLYIAILGATD